MSPLEHTNIGPVPVSDTPESTVVQTPAPADPQSGTLPQTEPMTEPVPVPPAPFPVIPGYRIEAELGRGGMGVVFRATQLGLNRPVAIKMVLNGQYATADAVRRFRAEAEAIARLKHPNVVGVYDLGEVNGQPFFVLEFVNGGGLDRKLKDGPLPPAEAAELLAQLADGVQAAHASGIVHRDLKPANVLLQEASGGRQPPVGSSPAMPSVEPRASRVAEPTGGLRPPLASTVIPKVADFGLAKDLGDGGHTQTGAVMGTPMYMAPEQAAGKVREIGPRTDVYSLGAILYECLTGAPPFKGESVLSTLDMVRSMAPRSLRGVRKEIPPGLEAVCLRCLEKDPKDRYESAAALAADLRRAAAGEHIRPVRRIDRRRWAAVAAGVLLAAVAAVAFARKPAAVPVEPPVPTGGVHALLVAVSEYDTKDRRVTWQFAERDVTETARLLEDRWGVPKANVRLLTKTAAAADPSRAPTGENLRAELARLSETVTDGSTLFVFLSGTGFQAARGAKGPLAMQPVAFHFLPLGGDPDRPGALISYSELTAALAAVPARQKLLLVDACRQVHVYPPGRLPLPSPPPDDPRTGVFFACRAGEESREDSFIRHGVFARGVLNALDPDIGAAKDDGRVTVGEMVRFAEDEVASAVDRLKLPPQKPELVGRLPADAVLLAR